jgi:hypothetical protein
VSFLKKYISEIIQKSDIENWQYGNRIIIAAQTGSGKSEFIKSILYDYCVKNNKNILLLSNRVALKNQNAETIGDDKKEVIDLKNYQELEVRILSDGDSFDDLIKNYDYVIYDEAHYIFSDSEFNRNTDLIIKPLVDTPDHSVFIFITATPQALLDYQPNYHFRYTAEYDYSYIENVYFYTGYEIAESIIQSVPKDEKVLFFGSNAERTLNLKKKFDNSAFICSRGNPFHKSSDTKTLRQIETEEFFNKRLLFATKVLDNGINIKDDKVKHVIIDMIDPISFLQCLGRKRIMEENDHINIYVKDYHNGNIHYSIQQIEEKLSLVKEFQSLSIDDFKRKYRKTDFDNVIDNDYNLNIAKYQNLITQRRLLFEILNLPGGYKEYICSLIYHPVEKALDGNSEFEKRSVRDILLKYENIKIYKEDQEVFKNLFFDKIFSPKKTDYRRRGLRSINAILEEDNIQYVINSRREKVRDGRRDETYWVVIPISNDSFD